MAAKRSSKAVDEPVVDEPVVDESAALRSQGKAERRAVDKRHESDLLIYASLCVIDTEIARAIKLGCEIPRTVVKSVSELVRVARQKTLLRKPGNLG